MVRVTFGEKASDWLTSVVGSWKFVIGQALFLAVWFTLNTMQEFGWLAWDKYPFILANLFMSAEAAFTAPIIMMSNNRSAAADSAALLKDVKLDEESLDLIKLIKERQELLLSRDEVTRKLDGNP